MTKIAGPATGARLDKRPDALGFAGKSPIRLQLGHLQSGARQAAAQDALPPIQAGLLQLPGMAVSPQGMLRYQMQVVRDKIEDRLIPNPPRRLAVDFHRRRLEEQQMAAVFQGGHVSIECVPVVTHQRYPAAGGELPRDVVSLQGRSRALPRERFGHFRLAHGLEQADALAVRIEAVDVVQDDGLIAVLVSLKINPKRCGLAADPADLSAQRLADTTALANTR